MKTRNAILAVLFLMALGVSSCAALNPPAVEQEEEITQPTMKTSPEKENGKEYRGPWRDNPNAGD